METDPQKSYPQLLILLRGSVFTFVSKLVVSILIFSTIRILIRFPLLYLDLNQNLFTQLYTINTIIVLLLIFFEVLVVLIITLTWVNEYYEVSPGQIIHKRGILIRKENTYTCQHIQTIDLDQGFIGRIFNYGTLTLYSPALEDKIYLNNIDKPQEYIEKIKKILDYEVSENTKGTIFLRGQ